MPYIDDVAADFPGLTVILAHPAFPWQDEQLAMLVHKPNCYMDLSGWGLEYVQPNLIQYANTLITPKVLFGSDYPGFSLERWFQGWEKAAFRADVRRRILFDNANALLGLHLVYSGP
jgi:predicted TIM-barrel fold metal-dependent hydrolase